MNAARRRIVSAAPLVGLLVLAAGVPATGGVPAATAAEAGVGDAGATVAAAVAGGAVDVLPGGAAYRTLRRAGISVAGLGSAGRHGTRIVLPVADGTAGRVSELRIGSADGFALRRGSRTVRVTGLRMRLAVTGSRVTGRIGGRRSQTLFTLGWRSLRVDRGAATARATKAPWRLSVAAARELRRRLGVSALRPGVLASSTVAVRLAGGVSAPPAPPVATGPEAAAGYALDWGVRESFRNYIVGGSVVASDGATVTAAGTYRFPVTAVTALDATGALSASFRGTVYFEKHGKGDAAMLRLWVRNPRIEAPAGAVRGALYADMTSRSLSAGRIVEYPNVRLAEIDLTAGSRALADGRVVWSGVPTRLAAEGVDAFAGFYVAGDPLDPIALSVAAP